MEPNLTPEPSSQSGEAPEKYIRTLEGDIDVFQRGGTPGLAPIKRPTPAPSERLIAPSPITAEVPVAHIPEVESKVEPPPSVPAPKPLEPERPVPIETYSEDFRQRLKETHASTATVLAAEQDAAPQATAPTLEVAPSSARNLWYIAAGVVLLVIGGVGTYIAYSKYLTAVTPVVIGPSNSAPIFVDTSEQISGTGRALVQSIVQSVAKPLPQNTVRQLTLIAATSSSSIFLSLGAPVPGILVRNLNETGNMAGVVNAKEAPSPFFILSVGLYSATFSGMLSWEPSMQKDLALLYPLYVNIAATASSTAATTTSATASTTAAMAKTKEGFRDEVVSNHDVRVYRDQKGRSIILYGYWNPTTLIIARDPIAFAEILDRLATSRAQ